MTKLLLIIDMQEGFRTKESEAIIETITNIKTTFEGKVVFTKFIDNSGSLFEKQLSWTLFQNILNTKIFHEFSGEKTIHEHTGYTILTHELKRTLKQLEIQQVYITGIYTDVCILKLAMDLFDFGLEVFIIQDSCASLHGEQSHLFAINSLRYILGSKNII